MPSQSGPSANDPNDAMEFDPSMPDLGPTDAEIEAWAQQERERREAWLRGPTQAQKSDWAARERVRREAQRGLRGAASRLAPGEPRWVLMQRYAREAQLAAEGAVSLMFSMSVRDMVDQLVQAGREWEDEYTTRPARRRVTLDAQTRDTASETERRPTSGGDSPGTSSPTS